MRTALPAAWSEKYASWLECPSPWCELVRVGAFAGLSFDHQLRLYRELSHSRPSHLGPLPVWTPGPEEISGTRAGGWLRELGLKDFSEFHAWSTAHRMEFWRGVVERLDIKFSKTGGDIAQDPGNPEQPGWFPGARLNIVDSCFQASQERVALLYQSESGREQRVTYGELDRWSGRVARGLQEEGLAPGDGVGVVLPLTPEAVAIYLGILRAGCVAIAIADSFAGPEIEVRLRIGRAKRVFTQDVLERGGRRHPLYEKVIAVQAPKAFVSSCQSDLEVKLRKGDLEFRDFLPENSLKGSVQRSPDDAINLLFSSGTTGEPKAIAWDQTTPIKCAMDAAFHQDIDTSDILCWPTSLGWMMGPWSIFASLINRATLALYGGAPAGREFGTFISGSRVTMLGVVPSMVKSWRESGCMEGLDWSHLRCFSSTGECSSPEDMLYLMSLANYRPVIEYCGGTEIGGGYITGSLLQPAAPGLFTTPALGLNLMLLDESGRAGEAGEVFIEGPSPGLSRRVINRDHHELYFAGSPIGPSGQSLRRHGDRIEKVSENFYRAQGRVDDTMNLGGIKTSSAEIEALLNLVAGLRETAAVAVPPAGGGPDRLVVFVVLQKGVGKGAAELQKEFQAMIKEKLNPLFKIHEVVSLEALPRTASNKILRRTLRDNYINSCA